MGVIAATVATADTALIKLTTATATALGTDAKTAFQAARGTSFCAGLAPDANYLGAARRS